MLRRNEQDPYESQQRRKLFTSTVLKMAVVAFSMTLAQHKSLTNEVIYAAIGQETAAEKAMRSAIGSLGVETHVLCAPLPTKNGNPQRFVAEKFFDRQTNFVQVDSDQCNGILDTRPYMALASDTSVVFNTAKAQAALTAAEIADSYKHPGVSPAIRRCHAYQTLPAVLTSLGESSDLAVGASLAWAGNNQQFDSDPATPPSGCRLGGQYDLGQRPAVFPRYTVTLPTPS